MKISVGITRGLTAAALFGLIVLAVMGFLAQERDLEGLRESSQESIFWDASQGEAELARFVAALGRFAVGDESVTAAEVNTRFDILWSRITLFEQGEVGRRLAAYDEDNQVIAEIRGLLNRYEEDIVNFSRPVNEERVQQILADFTKAGEHLRDLSLEVMHAEEARLALVRDHVRASARLTWAVSMAALLLALLLVGIMLLETRRYRAQALESAELAARAEAASQAKSRFLTMMSHELRTPMNGVLGILALVRQTLLNERQQRLVDRAERSGRQMSTLLGDILDFSDLQNEKLVLARETFELAELAHEIDTTFGPIIRREGVAFGIDIDADAPRWAVGDLARLRQALGHFLTFFVDVIGSRDVRIRMRRAGPEGVRFEIDAAVQSRDLPGWQPEAIFDRAAAEYGDFASDALGPTIGRGLITLMGGSFELRRLESERATLAVTVPMPTVDARRERVRVEADSVTGQAVLEAHLRRLGYALWQPGEGSHTVSAVLMEAGGEDETQRAARLRSDHPGARLIAVGEPAAPALFDTVLAQPLTREALQATLGGGARSRSTAM